MLIRPCQHGDESAAGYLLRLAYRNGIEPTWIETDDGRHITSAGLGLARWCAECMASPHAFWKSTWTSGLSVCFKHRCWLVDQCPVCERRASWRSLKFLHCRCGAATHEARPIPWSEHLSTLVHPPTELEASQWAAFSLEQRWRLAEVLGALDVYGLRGRPIQRASAKSAVHQAVVVTRGALIVVRSSEEMPRLLERLRVPQGQGQQVQLAREAWPGLQRLLRSQLGGDALQWVLGHLDRHAQAEGLSAAVVLRRRVGGHGPSGSRGLATRLGVRVERIPELLLECNLSPPERRSKSGRRMLVVTDSIDGLMRERLDDRIGARAAQRRFGLSSARLERLYAASLVARVGRHYVSSSIQSLLSGVAANARAGQPTSGTTISLMWALRVLVARERTAEFFQALLSGTVRVALDGESARGTSNVALYIADVKAWLSAQEEVKKFVLVAQAAVQLGLKQEVVYHLVRVGLIAASYRQVGRRLARVIELEEVDRFRRDVVPLSVVARASGIDFRSAKAWATHQGLELLSGPGIDGGRQFFVRIPIPTCKKIR